MKKIYFLAFLWACISAIGLGFCLWASAIYKLNDLSIAIIMMLYLAVVFTVPYIVAINKGWIKQQ